MKTPAISRRGWVTYDGDCRFCVALAARLRPLLGGRGFDLIPLQSEQATRQFNLGAAELRREMRVLECNGKITGGADAVVHLAKFFWWAAPLRFFAQLPFCMRAMRAGYRWIAERRTCANGVCTLTSKVSWPGWLPLLILPFLAVQWFVFARPFLTNAWLTLGYHTLTLTFICLSMVYGWAAFIPIS